MGQPRQRLVDSLCVVTDADPALPKLPTSERIKEASDGAEGGGELAAYQQLPADHPATETDHGTHNAVANPVDTGQDSGPGPSDATAEGETVQSPTMPPGQESGMATGPDKEHDEENDEDGEEEEALYNRAADLQALTDELGATDVVHIAEAPHTLEADLLEPGNDNVALLGTAYLRQKPRSKKVWKAIAESADPAQAFYERLRANKKLISKGEFAHDVAQLIAEGGAFTCPEYLQQAITFITKNPSHD